jgi:tRNA(Ile)-lysidine synthase
VGVLRRAAPRSPPKSSPLQGEDFRKLMSQLGPFEDRPHLAVAVSGGADSMALCLLASRWARARHGKVTALTVDHRLRPESVAEARQVARWCRALGVSHVTLRWAGRKPKTGIQAAARAARYRLLERWCDTRGVIHLLVAHHADDQAETVALRRERGSGEDGLAGMAAVVETPNLRILRPLLAVPKSRLVATLKRAGQGWIEDPSNRDPKYGRVRVRQSRIAVRPIEGRARRDAQVAALLASAFVQRGRIECDAAALAAAEPAVARRALARLVMGVGGAPYPPATTALDRVVAALATGNRRAARTLGFCRIEMRGGRVVVTPEKGRKGAPRLAPQPLVPARFATV